MAQQSQPAVPFNALKPATWGSLKLLPLALRSKLTGANTSDEIQRVASGKENANDQPAALQAPPKLGNLSHLQAIGPRRNVNQRYVLQPNLTVSRLELPSNAPGLSGLLLSGLAPIATQKQQQHHYHQEFSATLSRQQATPPIQRASTPSSPSLRGRQPAANPNFGPPAVNISTRLPTPVRINASPRPSPSPTSVAPMLPKPPSPSRSLSQGGAAPTNPFAYTSACSSPAATTTATSNTFMLPTAPSILSGDVPPPARTGLRTSPVPWASTAGQGQAGLTTPLSVRPSPPASGRSILASVQIPNQQRGATAYSSPVLSVSASAASGAAIPGHSEWLAPVAAPAPNVTTVSPVLSAPAIQAALQQTLQEALERKPEAFRLDNFDRFFDSVLMHPGDARKLDGPLPHELADDVRYGDNWYRHCREWNTRHKHIAAPYSAPTSAGAPETPSARRLTNQSFAGELQQEQQNQEKQETVANTIVSDATAVVHLDRLTTEGPQLPWSLDEPPLSEACSKALDIALHGLRKVLTPVARSPTVSEFNAAVAPTASSEVETTTAPLALLQHPWHVQQAMPSKADAEAVPADEQALGRTEGALAAAIKLLAREQAGATTTATPLVAANEHGDISSSSGSAAAAESIDTPVRAAMKTLPPFGRRFSVPPLLLSSLDGPMLPTAAGASLSPPPDSARPPSTAATTPGPRTPSGDAGGGANSIATTAATTPVGRDTETATTPTTASARRGGASPFFETLADPNLVSSTKEPEHTGSKAVVPLRKLSRELAAVEYSMDAPVHVDHQLAAEPALSVPPITEPSAPGGVVAAGAPASPHRSVEPWMPAFPEALAALPAATVVQWPPSPVTLLHTAPHDMPTPNPAFFGGSSTAATASGSSALAAAVASFVSPSRLVAAGGMANRSADASTSFAAPAADSLKDIVVGIEKLSTLKRNILAENKEVDVASITQMIQLKLAVEQLLMKTSSAAQGVARTSTNCTAVGQKPEPAAAPSQTAVAAAEQVSQANTPKKHSRTASFGAFLKGVFSPRSSSNARGASAAVTAAVPAAPKLFSESSRTGNTSSTAAAIAATMPASPSIITAGIRALRPVSASALPRQAASPSLADRARYSALHQRAAVRLTEAAAAEARPGQVEDLGGAPSHQGVHHGGIWQRYEEKVVRHRLQLDSTKAQLDEAVRKLNDMQVEFDELLLCLGMESAKNKALCDAMRVAGLNPELILAAIEEQWMSGTHA